MFGDMEEKQREMKEKLSAITLEGVADAGAVKVVVTASREIVSIHIDKDKVNVEDLEQLEDLIMVAANRALSAAADREAEEAQNMLKNLFPPGFGGLGNLFG
jgi:nucleoid-associated protein EbfC